MARTELKKSLRTAPEIELTVTGRTSGRAISNPVWFVLEDERLYLLPITGSDSDWYRNVLKTPAIRIAAAAAEESLQATPVTDPDDVNEIVQKFEAKYGRAEVLRDYPRRDVAVEVLLG